MGLEAREGSPEASRWRRRQQQGRQGGNGDRRDAAENNRSGGRRRINTAPVGAAGGGLDGRVCRRGRIGLGPGGECFLVGATGWVRVFLAGFLVFGAARWECPRWSWADGAHLLVCDCVRRRLVAPAREPSCRPSDVRARRPFALFFLLCSRPEGSTWRSKA